MHIPILLLCHVSIPILHSPIDFDPKLFEVILKECMTSRAHRRVQEYLWSHVPRSCRDLKSHLGHVPIISGKKAILDTVVSLKGHQRRHPGGGYRRPLVPPPSMHMVFSLTGHQRRHPGGRYHRPLVPPPNMQMVFSLHSNRTPETSPRQGVSPTPGSTP